MTFWAAEDGGPRRRQAVPGSLGAGGARLETTTRLAPVTTMAVGDGDALYLLRHTFGEGAAAVVERIDPVSLEPRAQSPELAGGPVWPGGMAVHGNGSLYVVFGNHAHRLDASLGATAARTLPRDAPYNSFVTLPGGHLVTKDFGGSRPGVAVTPAARRPCELVVLSPALDVAATLALPEASMARLSADGDDIYVVGESRVFRVRWDGSALALDDGFTARYRTLEGQTYGWDCVLAAGAAWFLDDGDGSEAFDGTLRGHGLSTAPLHLVRVDASTGAVAMAEVSGQAGGLVANPPVVDERRRVVVGYDSGNGVVAGFDIDTLEVRWRRDQDHASHLLLYEDSGELVTGDGTDVVVLHSATGDELARASTDLGMQSVLFPCPGRAREFYVCALSGIARVAVT